VRLKDVTGERGALREAYDSLGQHLGAVLLFSAAVNMLYLAPSLYMLQVYDRVLLSNSQMTLLFLTFALFLGLLVLALLDEARAGVLARGAIRLERRLAPLVMRAALEVGNGPRPRMSVGLRDLDTVKQAAGGAPILALLDAPWAPIYLIVCFVIHPVIGGVVLLGCGVLAMLALANEQASRSGLEATIRDTQMSYTVLEGDQQAADAARALGMQSAIVARHTRERDRVASAQTRLSITSSRYSALIKFVRLSCQSMVLGAGALLAIDQMISPGQLIAATVLATRAFAPIEQIVGSWRFFSARPGGDEIAARAARSPRRRNRVDAITRPARRSETGKCQRHLARPGAPNDRQSQPADCGGRSDRGGGQFRGRQINAGAVGRRRFDAR
jgi:ATP-binding cassette subfamily C protein